MASISKTPSGGFRVLWYEGKTKRQKNFKTRAEAKKYASAIELTPEQRSSEILVSTLLLEYKQKITPKKASSRDESFRIDAFTKRPFASKTLAQISRDDIQNYVDERSKEVAPATVLRELDTLSAVFNWAKEQDLLTGNPARGLRLPKAPEHRERVATDDEIKLLLDAVHWDGQTVPKNLSQSVVLMFLIACKTGMRAGEILALEDAWIEGRVIHLPAEATKTRSRRDVALSKEALRLIRLGRDIGERPKYFGGIRSDVRDVLWRKLRARAGLGPVVDSEGRVIKEGLNFHDSRATFATWAASPNPKTGAPRLDVLALARQTGHKDLKMLQRYYRASAADIAKLLDD